MILTIAVVTWNRSRQLIEALQSCIECEIPQDTQFVIIDNASTDNTKENVFSFFEKNKYDFYYEKMVENIGCGNGRNHAYTKAKGDLIYVLDDDAYISDVNKSFFTQAISLFNQDNRIATLTSQIYDLVLKDNRVNIEGPMISENLYLCSRFCGGSHFIRRSFWGDTPPYYPNKYGLEELVPSLEVYDKGGLNVFASNLLIIHNPKINKWAKGSTNNRELVKKEISLKLYMKVQVYPTVLTPVLYFAAFLRCFKSLSMRETYEVLVNNQFSQTTKINKIKLSTVITLFKMFKFSVF